MKMIDLLGGGFDLDILSLLLDLFLGTLAGSLFSRIYVRYGRSLGNRAAFAANFIPVILAIVLIITFVRSSLALALGLVGALSIVRFRTPVKEPEDLSYLFLSIAVGLGLGAGQRVPAVVGAIFVALFLIARGGARQQSSTGYLLEIELPAGADPALLMPRAQQLLADAGGGRTVRMDLASSGTLLSLELPEMNEKHMSELVGGVRQDLPHARVVVATADGIART